MGIGKDEILSLKGNSWRGVLVVLNKCFVIELKILMLIFLLVIGIVVE